MANSDISDYQLLVETLREQIMNDTSAQTYVLRQAKLGLDHCESQFGHIMDENVRDELLCQYQVQAWNKLFIGMAI